MRKSLLTLLLLLIFVFANAQQSDSLAKRPFHKDQLLSKAKTQKTIGWMMVGTGAPVVVGSLIAIVALSSRDFDQGTALAILAGSTAYTIVGYSLIKSGNKNKREALSINLINHQLPPFLTKTNLHQPALSLQFKF